MRTICLCLITATVFGGGLEGPVQFRTHVIESNIPGGYSVIVGDFNNDHRPDVVGMTQRMTELGLGVRLPTYDFEDEELRDAVAQLLVDGDLRRRMAVEGEKIRARDGKTKAADLIQSFRNSYHPRVAVTVDLIATGTDIRPVEIVMFMRTVKSRVLFEQMKGRGVRVISPDELRAVTPDARAKTHFLIIDCVGVCEAKLADTKPLEKNPSVSFKALLEHAASGGTNDDYLSSLANRIGAKLLESIDRHGPLCATPGGVETPGLMLGLAGIGYGLLRLAEPAAVPSVLALAPPAPGR